MWYNFWWVFCVLLLEQNGLVHMHVILLNCNVSCKSFCDVVESQIVEMLLSPYVWQKQTWTIEDSYFIFAHCRKNLTTHRWARAAYIQGLVEPIWTARRHYYEDWLGRLMDTTTNDNQEPGRIENCDTC